MNTKLFAALIGTAFTLPAQAASYVLDYGSSAAQPFFGCTTPSGACGTHNRLNQGYGDVPGVVDVSHLAWDGGSLAWWNNDYNQLYGVAYNPASSNVAAARIDIVPLNGEAVTLTHFDLGGRFGKRNDVLVEVIDLGTGAALFSYTGSIGTSASGGTWGTATPFDVTNLSSLAGLSIRWDDPAVAGNTAIDNIAFTISPVPEPTTGALFVGGLAALAHLRRRRKVVAGAALLGAAAVAQAAGPQAYSMELRPAMTGASISPWIEGLNNLGNVVGRSDVNGDVIATLWATGAAQPLNIGHLPANVNWAMAYDVNDAGQIVGHGASGNTDSHAFRWTPGVGMQDLSLGVPWVPNSQASAINNAGQVVGSAGLSAALWQADNQYVDLGHMPRPGKTGFMSHAADISNNGFVVGGSYYSDESQQSWRWHAHQGWTALPDIAGGSGLYRPNAVNEGGWVAGYSYGNTGQSSHDARAVVWTPQGQALPVHDANWLYSAANDINDNGTVVGRGLRLGGGSSAWVWHADTGMVDLATLVVNLNGFRLGQAAAVNDLGQIAGEGWDMATQQSYVYLLTPTAAVPEPMSLALWLAGVGGLALRRLRRD